MGDTAKVNLEEKNTRKILGVDSQGIQKTMRGYHYFGDAVSQLALNTLSGLIGMLTFFYTSHIGLAAGTVGTIMMVTRVIDAFTDLIAGKVVDNTKSKYGKARPWFLWMAVPTMLIIVGLFTIPADASANVQIAYAFITNILATAVIFTFIAIPYGCMMATRTKSVEERGKMGISRAIAGYIVGMAIAIALIPMTNMLGGDQRAWIIVASVLALLSGVGLLITFFTSKEEDIDASLTEAAEEDENVPFVESMKILFKNKYWVIMLIVGLFMSIQFALSAAVGVFYARYVLGDENLVAIMGGIGLIPVIIGFVVSPILFKKFGLTKTVRIAFIIGIIGTGIRIFMPDSFMAALLFGAFATFGTIPLMMIGGVLSNNTIEYTEWKFGKRLVGMTNSAGSFGTKIGTGLGAAMIGWILALGGYNPTLNVQPRSAIIAIYALSIYIPFAIFVISYLLIRQYNLDEKYVDIVNELKARKGKH